MKHEEPGGISNFIDLLISHNIVKREDIERALKLQWEEGGCIEEHLVRLGLLNEDDIVTLIVKESPYKFLDIKSIEPDPEAVIHIPKRIARNYKLMAVRKSHNSLAVVMANPLDEEALEALRSVTDLNILPFVGKLRDLKEAIEKFYPEIEEIPIPETTPPSQKRKDLFIPDMTFSSFIVAPTNETAYSIALSIAQETFEGNTPVLIKGEPGIGKTHLLHSIGNYLMEKFPLKRVKHLSAGQLMFEIRTARVDNRLGSYLKDLKESDFLLIDGIDDIGDKNIERELSLILNEITLYGGKVVLTSRKSPSEIEMEDKLREVINRSLLANIEPPDASLKKNLLAKKYGNYDVPDEVLIYIAENTGSDIREAFGYIETLIAKQRHLGQPITIEEAEKLQRMKI